MTDGMATQRHCRIEVASGLPAGLRDELDRRFGLVQIRDAPGRTMLGGLMVDQARLRALLDMLWDAGVQVIAVSTTNADGDHPSGSSHPG
jgi:hypothetical protein